MRVILGGGGTGGHVYPALAVLEALRAAPHNLGDHDVLYVGDAKRAEGQLAQRAGVQFESVSTGAVVERGPIGLLASAFRNLTGTLQAIGVMRRFRPNVVFVTGGYISVPVVLAATLLRVPTVVCLPDAKPGVAVRFLARFASRITVSAPAAAAVFPAAKTVVTGYPVRSEFRQIDRTAARAALGVSPDERLLLVMGGSLGAHGINAAVSKALDTLLPLCRVVHVSGPADAPELQQRRSELSPALLQRYTVHPYLHDHVAATMAAADLTVCRAGASTLGELPCTALPAILVPYPLAGAHQRANAQLLVDAGAAIMLDEQEIAQLPGLVAALLSSPDRLASMRHQSAQLARPEASGSIASLLSALATGKVPTGSPTSVAAHE